MKTAKLAVALLATIALALTGCGGDSDAEPKVSDDPSLPDPPETEPSGEPSEPTEPSEPQKKLPWPCSAVPAEVAEGVWGTEITADSEKSTANYMSPQCLYQTEGWMVIFHIVDMNAFPGGPTSAAEALSAASGGNELSPVKGVGELAGFKDGPIGTLFVAMKRGGSYHVLSVAGLPEERDQLAEFAREIVARV